MNHIGPPTYIIILSLIITLSACGHVEKVEDADTDGDGPCPAGQTLCGDKCVDTDTDRLNCGACGHLCRNAPHAAGICAGGECDLDCDEGYWNHDDDIVNGCEYKCDISGEGNEICNGIDDDCDGVIDNFEVGSCPRGQVVSCETECGSEGTARCNNLCRPGDCDPPEETCNGIDDDCDGAADNGFDCVRGSTVACETSCGSTGTGTCNPDCTLPAPAGCQVPDEVCNWIDDNCNGEIDEDLFGVIVTVTELTDGADETYHPVIAFGLSNYVIAWQDGRETAFSELYSMAVDLSGAPLFSEEQLIGNDSNEFLSDMIWNGSQFGLAYYSEHLSSDQDMWFAVVDERAGRLDSGRILSQTNDQRFPSIVWDGSHWAITWLDNRTITTSHDIYFAKVDPDTLSIISSSEYTVSSNILHISYPDIAWSGSRYGVVWNRNYGSSFDIYVSILNDDGTTEIDDLPITSNYEFSLHPSIVWTSSEWIVSWCGKRAEGTQGYFMAILDEGGNKIAPEILVDSLLGISEEPCSPIVMSHAEGLGVGVAWQQNMGSDRMDIFFQRFTYNLEPVDDPIRITSIGMNSGPSITWDGAGFGIAWINSILEMLPVTTAVNFARVGCL